MDGYAVRAQDTFGASESLPALLEVTGEVLMGRVATQPVEPGRAVLIPTGGMLPAGADAVVMVEYTQPLDEQTIEVTRPVAPGENVLQVGEDVGLEERVLTQGLLLRPQDLGVLAALGLVELPVYRQPRVAVISTGDEIVPCSRKELEPGKVRDINSTVIAGQVVLARGAVGQRTIVDDDLGALTDACLDAFQDHDVVLLSGGSSVGARDHTVRVLERLPDSELLVHGVAIRPGKPTILGRVGKKWFVGLPGQPASAMIVFSAFVRPLIERLQGLPANRGAWHSTQAVLARSLPSVHGRADYVRVALEPGQAEPQAEPVFGKSAMISTLSRADGYVVIPEHVEGLEKGTRVTVHLF